MTRLNLLAVSLALIVAGCSPPAEDADSESPDAYTAVSGPVDVSPDASAANIATQDGSAETVPTGASAEAVSTPLHLGDKAPDLSIGNWFRGDPVDEFQEGLVYVVEFWATWCGPCKQTMPYISELQSQYGDEVTFIGVTDEAEEQVVTFFEAQHPLEREKTWDDVATYTIALDDNRQTNRAYMEASQQAGIPTAFVVGRSGLIEWIGHPMAIAEPLREILDGTWDVGAAREAMEAERRIEREMQSLAKRLHEARAGGDEEQALEVLDEMSKIMPENPQIGLDRFQVLLVLDRHDEAYEALEGVIASLWEHADFLEYLAVNIADEMPEPARRLDVALRVAERAVELTNRSTKSLDALARVKFQMGNLQEAIELQQEAVETASQAEGDFMDRLKFYLEQRTEEPAESESTADEQKAFLEEALNE